MNATMTTSPTTPPAAKFKLLDARQVAMTLGISVRSVWRLTAEGTLAAVRVGARSTRWDERAIERYIQRSTA